MSGIAENTINTTTITTKTKETYGLLDAIIKDMSNAPAVLKEEQEVKSKKELLKALRKGIVAYLKKGYSVAATTKVLNNKLTSYKITEAEVKKLLPKVTAKTRSTSGKTIEADEKTEDNGTGSAGSTVQTSIPQPSMTDDNSSASTSVSSSVKESGETQSQIAESNTKLNVPIEEKDEAKALGARWDADNKKWFVPKGRDLNKFLKWLSKPDIESKSE